MTHDELLTKLNPVITVANITKQYHALRAVVELHKPYYNEGLTVGHCKGCQTTLDNITRHVSYPCPTIQAIKKELEATHYEPIPVELPAELKSPVVIDDLNRFTALGYWLKGKYYQIKKELK